MKIAIYNGKKDVELKDVDMPVCGDNDILVKNMYAAICGSDVTAYYHGGDDNHVFSGYEFGHEMVSRVEKVGKNVKDIEVGQYVYPYPLFAKGDSSRAATVGGFSEYILIPNCELNKSVYLVKEGISLKEASLIEPFTVGTRAARRAEPKEGETAIVFGAGAIGVSAAIALKFFGCGKVMLVDLSDYRLEKCKALGFEVCNSKKEDLKVKAMEVFGKARGLMGETANVDIYIDAVGANSVVESYEQMKKLMSRLCVVGVHHEPTSINLMMLAYSQTAIIGSGGYMPEDVRDVMTIMASKKFDIESIISHEFKQEDLVEAIETAGRTDESLKVVIKYE
jgi:2-desacetyl-2-hydroxyethyl bacteriochlorophyllide A dehydrogenase